MAIRAIEESYDKSGSAMWGSTFLNSSYFCADYEKLCGTACIDINAVLHPEKANKTNAATDVED